MGWDYNPSRFLRIRKFCKFFLGNSQSNVEVHRDSPQKIPLRDPGRAPMLYPDSELSMTLLLIVVLNK